MKFTVQGRVQGVGYRHFTFKTATGLGLTGWVRNLTSGDVEVEAYGPEGLLNQLLERCQEGPPASQVERLFTVLREPASHSPFPIFEIRRTD